MENWKLALIFIAVVGGLIAYSCTYNETNHYYNYTPVVKTDLDTFSFEFVRLINEHRIAVGLNTLIPEELASEVCRLKNLEDIANGVPPSHYHWEKMIRDSKVEVNNGAQIIGENYLTPLALFNAYLTSPSGHRDVIESENKTHIGTSTIERRNYTLIIKH